LTLPDEVLEALRTLHRDPGWAIVRLVEPILRGARSRRPKGSAPLAELVNLPGSRALIVVQPDVFRRMPGVSLIPLADGRAFLAFQHAGRLADFEVAILDQLESARDGSRKHAQLRRGLDIVRTWRRDPNLAVSTRSIIVVDRRRRRKTSRD
jgi:hypothetical protein